MARARNSTRRWLGGACLLAVLASGTAPAAAEAPNLLLHRSPMKVEGVRNARVLTDGVSAPDGDDWNTDVSAVFESGRAFVQYDLGRVTPIAFGFLQGDNNDSYVVQVSTDGKSFQDLWVASAVSGAGLRPRSVRGLAGSGRYLRVSPQLGDGNFSLTELALFASEPSVFPPRFSEREGMPQGVRVRNALLFLAASLTIFLFVTGRLSGPLWLLLAALLPVLAIYELHLAIADAWPLHARELSLLRAVTAAAAALSLLRETLWPKRFAAHRVAVLGVLGLSGVLACASFYNFGHSQFWNAHEQRPHFVHTCDMRVYYPFAKYFEELSYDGVYLASAAAYLEDVPGTTLAAIGDVTVRDLTDHNTHKLRELGPQVDAIHERFTPARWQAFKRDMGYFREVMGPEYLNTMSDHGANATPMWVFFARLLFDWSPASDHLLVLGGLLDAFLFALLFVAIGWSFGLRPMFVAMVICGANDFYMFGTNWGGATLRHDWLVYLGLGVCALHSRRFVLAGVLFGLSSMIRAFPGVALIGVTFALCWWFAQTWLAERRPPTLRTILREQQPAVRVLVGAGVCMLAFFLLTSALYSFGSWAAWWYKVTLLNSQLAVNDESLKVLVAGVDGLADKTLRARAPLYVGALLFCVALVALACRRRRLDQAAVLALPLIPVLTNPSNYYDHFVFLLPLLGTLPTRERAFTGLDAATRDANVHEPSHIPLIKAAMPMLVVCVAQYWTTLDPDIERHFQSSTALLFGGLAWFYYNALTASSGSAKTS